MTNPTTTVPVVSNERTVTLLTDDAAKAFDCIRTPQVIAAIVKFEPCSDGFAVTIHAGGRHGRPRPSEGGSWTWNTDHVIAVLAHRAERLFHVEAVEFLD